ncbi:MAG: M1 family metallopeptidase [Lewinellaceae bacterium]|nr:M1 family metallopeptidase [Lewinellaceae bacterium]
MLSKVFLPLALILFASDVMAQGGLPMPRNLQAAFDKGTRSHDGMPGKMYWQNSADYDISVEFDPTTRLIAGTESIVYYNNSPDTLREIAFFLYPNLYRKGSRRMMAVRPDDLSDGIQFSRFLVNGEPQQNINRRANGTNMRVRINPLAPGASARFEIDYSYVLNKGSHIRTGEVEEGASFVAYFFPRIAVYDDIDGWNNNPYLGTQEFYNDFCNFKLAVKVPTDFLVWATGDLLNCDEVLAPGYCERLKMVEQNDALATIVDTVDLKAGNITAKNDKNTFRFEARHVTDVAFAVSNHYIWKSSSVKVDPASGRRTRVDAVFNPKHLDYFLVLEDARKTVEAMSYVFPKWPFPYAHETVFDGLDQMEYPMMVNDNPVEDRAESIELTDHEIFHTMFPFYMGTNETKYGWMDEGWATIGEWLISPIIDTTLVDTYGVSGYERVAGTETDLPVMTLTTHQSGAAMFVNSYPKPAMGYLFVKDMLGDELFLKGLHHYIRTWNGKHPIPYDFFNCMNAGTGVDLNWFWKRWFFDDGVPDLAISNVTEQVGKKKILVESKGEKPVPVDLAIKFDDGSTEHIHYSIEIWKRGNRTLEIEMQTEKNIEEILLGGPHTPDIDKSNNVYRKK